MRDLERERMDSNDEASGARTSGPAAEAPRRARRPESLAVHSGEPVGLGGPATVTDGRKPRKPERPDIVL